MYHDFVYNHFDKRGRKPLQERVEPAILTSRLMTFVMATALVVLVVLIVTLDKMFPLNRPQIFILTTQTLGDKELTLTQMPEDLAKYKENFVRDYVLKRNEIVDNLMVMRARWGNNDNGVIKARSTDAVFGDFATTYMARFVHQDLQHSFDVQCNVEFYQHNAVVLYTSQSDTYTVKFTYICHYGPDFEREYRQNYELTVKLKSTAKNAIRWTERMENPLGFKVSEYKVEGDQGDPLNWPLRINEQEKESSDV